MPRPLLKLVVTNRPEQTFPSVWAPYPRKEAKKDAAQAWHDLDPDASLVAEIIRTIEWQAHLWTVIEQRLPNRIPLLGTYLRNERWTDERPASMRDWKRKQLDQQQAAVDEQMEVAQRFQDLMATGLTREEAREIIHREKGWIA